MIMFHPSICTFMPRELNVLCANVVLTGLYVTSFWVYGC